MKIIWKVTGYYEWIPQGGNSTSTREKTNLADLLTDLQAIATQQKQYQIATIHQSFGLGFLPKHTLTHLLQYNSVRSSLRSPLMNERTLCPLLQNPADSDFASKVQRFSCQFTTTQLPQNFKFPLSFDDPQIPSRNTGDQAMDTYRITIENQPNQRLQSIRNQAIQELQQFIKTRYLDFLHIALKPLSSDFSISLPLSNNCTALVQLRELPTDLQQAIKYLRKPQRQELTEQVQSIVRAYRARYSQTIPNSRDIPNLSVANNSGTTEFVIGKRISRATIENLITNAKKFLMICSYRIEDPAIAQMLARKAQEIPIWILTEFNDNVQNRVDANMVGRVEVDPEYAILSSRYCDLVLTDNIEKPSEDLIKHIQMTSAIVFSDVLEHLYNPWQTLKLLRSVRRHQQHLPQPFWRHSELHPGRKWQHEPTCQCHEEGLRIHESTDQLGWYPLPMTYALQRSR